MAVRNDLSIDWNVNPRIITVDAPSTEITMQDLLDTLRDLEASDPGRLYPSIVDGSGKEPLDSTTKNGITISILDARLGFEARTDWTQCSFKGGNLVAFDGEQVELRQITANTPVHPTPFVNIDRASSSSGTLQEQKALQYSSFGDQITIDELNGNSGTTFPTGTIEYPVNNVQDAVTIAGIRGLQTLKIIGSITMDTGDVAVGFNVVGSNTLTTQIIIKDGALVESCVIKNCTLSGVLDGGCVFRDSSIKQLSFVSGVLFNCGLNEETVTLGGAEEAIFLDCYSLVSGNNTPTLDMNGAGQSLGIRNYSGGLRILNRTSNDPCSIDMNSGHLIIDASCTGDPIIVRGSCILTVESGATQPITEGRDLIEQCNIPKQVWDYPL